MLPPRLLAAYDRSELNLVARSPAVGVTDGPRSRYRLRATPLSARNRARSRSTSQFTVSAIVGVTPLSPSGAVCMHPCRNRRPRRYVYGDMDELRHVIIIGGGPAGYT